MGDDGGRRDDEHGEIDRPGDRLEVRVEPLPEGTCSYRTCYPVTIWPIAVSQAGIGALPLGARDLPKDAKAVMRIELRCAA